MMLRIAFGLLIIAVFLAPWWGGKLLLDVNAIAPDEWFSEIFITRHAVFWSHAILGVIIISAWIIAILKQSVILLPSPKVLSFVALFWFLLFFSFSVTQFPHDYFLELAKWTIALMAMFTVVALSGRTRGAKSILLALFAGIVVISISALIEYITYSAHAPNWRVFGGWHNPNAFASILSLSLPVLFAFGLVSISDSDNKTKSIRFIAILLVVGLGLTLCALWLTASKGGLLSFSVGLLVFFTLFFLSNYRKRFLHSAISLGALSLLFAGLIVFAAYRPVSDDVQGGATRLAASSEEIEQSVGFRRKLWEETFRLSMRSPILGFGLGSYPNISQRYFTIESSKLAHNSYLQISAEAGFICLFAFLAAGVMCIYYSARKHTAATDEMNILRMGIVGSLFAGGVNAFVESSFSFSGFSIIFFVLFGLALSLSSDGARTERLFLPLRVIFIALVGGGCFFITLLSAISDSLVASGMHYATSAQPEKAMDYFRHAKTAFRVSPRPDIMSAQIYLSQAKLFRKNDMYEEARNSSELALSHLEKAIKLKPTASLHSLLAEAYDLSGYKDYATNELYKAIELAPHSPYYKSKLFEFLYNEVQNNNENLISLAQELVQSEKSDYYVYDPLPQFIKTYTIKPRLFLAEIALQSGDINKQIYYLEGAFEILYSYFSITIPELKRMTNNNLSLAKQIIPSETEEKMNTLKQQITDVKNTLTNLYKETNNTEKAAELLTKFNKIELS